MNRLGRYSLILTTNFRIVLRVDGCIYFLSQHRIYNVIFFYKMPRIFTDEKRRFGPVKQKRCLLSLSFEMLSIFVYP